MAAIARTEILAKFRAMVARGQPIVGGGAGTGLSAKAEEAGGIDLIIIYNSGRYRMAGRGSAAGLLAYGNANEIVKEMAREVLPVVKNTPVLAGVNGTDRSCSCRSSSPSSRRWLSGPELPHHRASLASCAPRSRRLAWATGWSRDDRSGPRARSPHHPYVFSPQEARDMTEAGADVVVAHMGVTPGGAIGAKAAKTLEQCVGEIDAIAAAARAVREDIIVLCHGGPIAMPDDAKFILARSPHCHGFYGASSMERLPVEVAIAGQVRDFKSLPLRG